MGMLKLDRLLPRNLIISVRRMDVVRLVMMLTALSCTPTTALARETTASPKKLPYFPLVKVVCPPQTRRHIRMLRLDASALNVGLEQAPVELRCRRRDGTVHGPVVRLRANAPTSARDKRDFVHGRHVVWFGEVVDGKRHGTWVQLNRLGRQLGTIALVEGSGQWRAWHQDGAVALNGELRDGRRVGQWRYQFRSGKMAVTGAYENDDRQGEWRWFYASGGLLRAIDFRRGQRHGLYTEWWLSGNKRTEGGYNQGMRDGQWMHWNRAGTLLGTTRLRNGAGRWATWHDGGTLRHAGPMADDKRVGRWLNWYESGVLRGSGDYTAGRKSDGTWQYWDETGKLVRKRHPAKLSGGILGRLVRYARLSRRAGAGTAKGAAKGTAKATTALAGGQPGSRRTVIMMGRTAAATGLSAPHRSTANRGPRLRRNPAMAGRARLTAVGGVRDVTIAWAARPATNLSLSSRQARVLKVLVLACARRATITSARSAPPSRGGRRRATKPLVRSMLRWSLTVRPDGTVGAVRRIATPPTMAPVSALRCVDYVVGRAIFRPRLGSQPVQVTLSATLIH